MTLFVSKVDARLVRSDHQGYLLCCQHLGVERRLYMLDCGWA
jgi:hypothetical protein